jgi:hypothetical protein
MDRLRHRPLRRRYQTSRAISRLLQTKNEIASISKTIDGERCNSPSRTQVLRSRFDARCRAVGNIEFCWISSLGLLSRSQISPYDVYYHPLIDKCSPRSGQRRRAISESVLCTAGLADVGLLVLKTENARDTIWPICGHSNIPDCLLLIVENGRCACDS